MLTRSPLDSCAETPDLTITPYIAFVHICRLKKIIGFSI